jgi:hypothetical protein
MQTEGITAQSTEHPCTFLQGQNPEKVSYAASNQQRVHRVTALMMQCMSAAQQPAWVLTSASQYTCLLHQHRSTSKHHTAVLHPKQPPHTLLLLIAMFAFAVKSNGRTE